MSLLSYTGGQQLVMLSDSLNRDENQERTHLFCALFSGQGDPVADRANACPPPFIIRPAFNFRLSFLIRMRRRRTRAFLPDDGARLPPRLPTNRR